MLVLGVAVDNVAQREARRLRRLEHVRRVLARLAAREVAASRRALAARAAVGQVARAVPEREDWISS